MTSAQYEAIMWEKEMKKKIISHARAVFVGQVRRDTAFEVVTTTSVIRKKDEKYTVYASHIIALEEFSHEEKWKVLMSAKQRSTEADGLDLLMRGLQFRLSPMLIELEDVQGA